ncbi:hypothetical protein O6C87_00915, partial [Legionella pneumophila]
LLRRYAPRNDGPKNRTVQRFLIHYYYSFHDDNIYRKERHLYNSRVSQQHIVNTALFIPTSILHVLDQDFWLNVLQSYKIIIQHLQGLKKMFY